MASAQRDTPKRKLDPLNLPKESVEPLVNLLNYKQGSAIMKERAVEVVGNLAEEEIQGPGPTALVQCDAIQFICNLIKEDRSPKTYVEPAPPPRARARNPGPLRYEQCARALKIFAKSKAHEEWFTKSDAAKWVTKIIMEEDATLPGREFAADCLFQLIKMSPKMNEQVAKALGCKPSETNEKVDELDEEDD